MNENPLQRVSRMGQSIWLDYLRRKLVTGLECDSNFGAGGNEKHLGIRVTT